MTSPAPAPADINSTIRYTMWSVFAVTELLDDPEGASEEVEELLADLAERGLEVRGFYDLAGFAPTPT